MPRKSKSRTTADGPRRADLVRRRLPRHQPPTHPGEMLLEEFLKPLDTTQTAFALQLGVSFQRLNEVIDRKRSVTPDTALRLARVTGMSADFWLGLQQDWDLWHVLRSDGAEEIERTLRGNPGLPDPPAAEALRRYAYKRTNTDDDQGE